MHSACPFPNLRNLRIAFFSADVLLEIKLNAKLELARVERGGRAAVVKSAGALCKRVDLSKERIRRCFVESIK